MIIETRGEAHGTQQTEMIFAKAGLRIADSANDLVVQVVAAANEIQHFIAVGIEEQGVDGEVATQDILARVGFKIDGFGVAAVDISVVTAECGDLHLRAGIVHQHDAEMRTHQVGLGKQRGYFAGLGVGRNIVIFRLATQQKIAHAPADKVRLMAARLQPGNDLSRQLDGLHVAPRLMAISTSTIACRGSRSRIV